MCSSPLGECAEPAVKRRKNKKYFTSFHPVQFFAHRYMPDNHTKDTRTQSVVYLRQTTEYSNGNYPKTTHHNVFLNTEKRDLRPYTSPEGARRMPPRGNVWRLQNGTLGAAMRLKALSQAPPEIIRHPNTSGQSKYKRKPEHNILDHHNQPHTRGNEVVSSPTCCVRGQLGEPGGRTGTRGPAWTSPLSPLTEITNPAP